MLARMEAQRRARIFAHYALGIPRLSCLYILLHGGVYVLQHQIGHGVAARIRYAAGHGEQVAYLKRALGRHKLYRAQRRERADLYVVVFGYELAHGVVHLILALFVQYHHADRGEHLAHREYAEYGVLAQRLARLHVGAAIGRKVAFLAMANHQRLHAGQFAPFHPAGQQLVYVLKPVRAKSRLIHCVIPPFPRCILGIQLAIELKALGDKLIRL